MDSGRARRGRCASSTISSLEWELRNAISSSERGLRLGVGGHLLVFEGAKPHALVFVPTGRWAATPHPGGVIDLDSLVVLWSMLLPSIFLV